MSDRYQLFANSPAGRLLTRNLGLPAPLVLDRFDANKPLVNGAVLLGSIDRSKLNINGSSLAAGHPFAATGGRIIATLAKMINEKGSGRGLISICAAGGQGVVAIIEK